MCNMQVYIQGELDAAVRERTRVRNCLVDGYHKVLPAVQRKLCLDAERQPQQHIDSRRECMYPNTQLMCI